MRSQTHKDGPCYFLLCKQTIPQISGWTQRLLTFGPCSSRSAVWAGLGWKVSAASQAALPLGVGWLLAARGWLGQRGDVAPCLSSPTRQARACLLPEAEDFQEQQGDLHRGRSAFQASVLAPLQMTQGQGKFNEAGWREVRRNWLHLLKRNQGHKHAVAYTQGRRISGLFYTLPPVLTVGICGFNTCQP